MKKFLYFFGSLIFALFIFAAGFLIGNKYDLKTLLGSEDLTTPLLQKEKPKELPLLEYSIPNLKNYQYQPSQIIIEDLIKSYEDYAAFVFSYTTMDKKMTGQINIPHSVLFNTLDNDNKKNQSSPVIVMLRGYVPAESYITGIGTKNAAGVFAKNGYVTLAPDFFGFGDSDPDFEDSWKGRFIKPINIIELIKSVQENPRINIPTTIQSQLKTASIATDSALTKTSRIGNGTSVTLDADQLGIWAHSNGGQIALTTLEVLSEPIPTTLWAPVTAPFPYSILFFTDELEDEGKASRAWVAMFEDDYDVFDFSLSKHLDLLIGPIQLQHGTADDAALIAWSDEFVDKIEAENERREKIKENLEKQIDEATEETSPKGDLETVNQENQILEPIDITYYKYPGANHNLQPGWDTAMGRDLKFFGEKL